MERRKQKVERRFPKDGCDDRKDEERDDRRKRMTENQNMLMVGQEVFNGELLFYYLILRPWNLLWNHFSLSVAMSLWLPWCQRLEREDSCIASLSFLPGFSINRFLKVRNHFVPKGLSGSLRWALRCSISLSRRPLPLAPLPLVWFQASTIFVGESMFRFKHRGRGTTGGAKREFHCLAAS